MSGSVKPSQKTFRTKQKLAKAGRQNRCVPSLTVVEENIYPNIVRPIPQWFRLKSDTKIQVCLSVLLGARCELTCYFNSTMLSVATGEGRS